MEEKRKGRYRVIVPPSKLFKSSLTLERNETIEFEVDEEVLRESLMVENVTPHPLFLFLPITMSSKLKSDFWFFEVVFNPMTGEFEVLLMGNGEGGIVEEEMELRMMPDFLRHLYPVMRIYPGEAVDVKKSGNGKKVGGGCSVVLSLKDLQFIDEQFCLNFLKDERIYWVFCNIFPENMQCRCEDGGVDERKLKERLQMRNFREKVRGFVQAFFLSRIFFDVLPSVEDVLNHLRERCFLKED